VLKTMIVLWMIFTLSACQTTYEQRLICKQIVQHQIPPTRLCDISFKYDRCRCRCFDYNSWDALSLNQCPTLDKNIGAVKLITENKNKVEVIDFELEYCDGIGGSFNTDQVTNVRPNVKALYRIKENLCQ